MGLLERIFGRKRREARRALEARVRETLETRGSTEAWRALATPLAVDRDPIGLFHLAAHVLRLDGELALAELFDRAADAPHDPQRLFELGCELLSVDEAALSAAMLERALAFAPFDAVVRSELALAHARTGRPDRVVETLALHPCLGDDPGALFSFAWASLLRSDLDSAEGALGELRIAPPLQEKLRRAIDRARLGTACDPPDARDWLFVEHGALLLDAGGPLGGRYDALDAGAEWTSAILSQARWLLPELAPAPRRVIQERSEVTVGRHLPSSRGVGMPSRSGATHVIAIDVAHRPLAEAVARACDGEVIGPGKGRIPAAIVPLLRGEDMKRLSREDLDAKDALLFALTVDFTRALPRVPDVIGAFARTPSISGALEARGAPDPSLRAFVEARRAYLRPSVVPPRTAYVPDEPLPR